MVYFWFRRDLRLDDNIALYHALKAHKQVQCVFIFDRIILDKLPYKDDARLSFVYLQIERLKKELKAMGSDLMVLVGRPVDCWKQILKEGDAIYFNKDYEPYALQRDGELADYIRQINGKIFRFKDQVIFEENEIMSQQHKPYTVYSPYAKKWMLEWAAKTFEIKSIRGMESHFYRHDSISKLPGMDELGFTFKYSPYFEWSPNMETIQHYKERRDFPGIEEGTSKIGLHLRFGTISIRKWLNQVSGISETYVKELIWREFFMQILFHFPQSAVRSFKPEYDRIAWRNDEVEFGKWCRGETGIPIVDAGMRELNESGYMHNRVRMIVASFLCKNLLIHWSWGAHYFAGLLLDYEESSNIGNWQWAAGSGCDAAPYFRVFNPQLQAEKFDPHALYIKKWCPEYDSLSYPNPIVDLKMSRQRAIDTYKKGLQDRAV